MKSRTSNQQTTSWNELIKTFPQPHVLQTSQWGELKSHFGWVPRYLIWEQDQNGWQMRDFQEEDAKSGKPAAAGLLLEREAFPAMRVLYMPKGPLLNDGSNLDLWEKVVEDLAEYAAERRALQLKIDPDIEIGAGVPGEEGYQTFPAGEGLQSLLQRQGWIFSREQIQYRNTVLVDLQEDEDQILARMKSKTRYNIRLSGRKGIQIRLGGESDLLSLYRMYAETSQRAGFAIRAENYYLTLWNLFLGSGMEKGSDPIAQPIIAVFEGELVAGAVIFKFGERAWYLHGMSCLEHSEKMAPHLIQWEAMRWAKDQGCKTYDMWGAPDSFDRSDSLWGVYRFKRGFGGQVSLTLGAWDYPARALLYTLYSRWLPKVLGILRWLGNKRTSRVARSER